MIDINDIRRRPDEFRLAMQRKKILADIDRLLELDDQRKHIQMQVDEVRRQRNELALVTGKLAADQREEHFAKGRELAKMLDAMEEQLRDLKGQIFDLVNRVPAIPAAEVPDGITDDDNVEIRRCGERPAFEFQPKDHLDLARLHGLANFEDARQFAGSRAYALTGVGALLEMALMRFAMDRLVIKGFTPVAPPVMVRENAMLGTGYFPVGAENAYALEQDNLFLVGTAEVPLVALNAGRVFNVDELPLRMAGISTCFRREAGAAGKDTKGLYRVHQFQKVEQVVITTDDRAQTDAMHWELLANAEEILQALELPYRVVAVCTGELGIGQIRKHDIETWMPSRNAYCETHSCSTLDDFQARRMNIRYVAPTGFKRLVHTLNNTAVATPRILIPLLENHQRADGTIYVPVALRPYLNGRETIG